MLYAATIWWIWSCDYICFMIFYMCCVIVVSLLLAERLSFCSCLLSAFADCVCVASAVSFLACSFWDTGWSCFVVYGCAPLASTWFVWLLFGCSFSIGADNDWPFCEFWEFCVCDSRFSVCASPFCCFCFNTLASWFVSAACACDVFNLKILTSQWPLRKFQRYIYEY